MVIYLRGMQEKLGLQEREIRRLVVPLLSLRDLFNFYPSSPMHLQHIAGKQMPADAFTKPSDVSILRPFMSSLTDIHLDIPRNNQRSMSINVRTSNIILTLGLRLQVSILTIIHNFLKYRHCSHRKLLHNHSSHGMYHVSRMT